ncbi:LPXTG cell wall anchor domain-containing protein [Micromonospora sp. GCM10011542]|uniref:LPXTG cell wall anchor domain-containing protein n=1 Tax=Micromonospora sp. GCM10011542 TaxID=3317337 RepID=UPI00361138FD
MNPPKSPFRRIAAIAAGALIGIAGAATVATPAFAHHPEPTGSYCAAKDGTVTVTWSVISSETDIDGVITKLESTVPGDITGGLAVGATLKKQGDGPLTGTQTHTFTGAIPELKLTVGAHWERDGRNADGERSVTAVPSTDCGPTESPSPSPSSSSPTPAPTKSPEVTPSPSTSTPASPSATPSLPAEPEEPVFELEQTCDKMTFIVKNPAKGIPFSATMTTEKGVTKTLVSEPGKTSSVSFDAYAGLKVTVKYDVVEDSETIPYTQPKNCGQGGGGEEDEPTLPLTGAATGGIIAGAALLLAAGAVLFVVARRRRVRFTA